tara:strand:+ start:2007 stop:2522 length:516 start_codon:yes stop_codon:yes gene_type:complete
MELINKALKFSTAAHAAVNHKRKYTGEDYIVHPIAVSNIVKENGGTEDMIAAALLHDTVEDTKVTREQIAEEFGWKVFKLVVELTDVTKPEDGNREIRKAIEAKRLGMASKEAQMIKLADLIDNTKSIFEHDPKFAKVYRQEKINLLEAMDKVHGTDLYMKANLQLMEVHE